MRKETNNTDVIRFLKDEKFIEWKLFSTDELDAHWHDFLQQHSDQRKNIELAEEHFRKINISSHKLPREKKREAIARLEQSLRAYRRKHRIRRLAYAAACAAVLILSILYIQKEINPPGQGAAASENYIVGNELEQEDILFITGKRSATFQGNVDIQIHNDQTAQIKREHEKDEEIPIEEHTLNKLIVPYGKQSTIILSDGTRAWLNSGSSLEFPSTFSGNERKVLLSGEMYIEVAPDKNKTFYVHTSGYDVKVYGTKFNVSAYPGSVSSVVLVEGSVSLKSTDKEKEEVYLSPEEQAIYSESTGTFDTRKVDVRSFISWKEGYLTFADTPVTEVLKQIERYYNLSFNYGDDVSLQGLTCTGKIILSDNLNNVMTALALISSTKYKKENNTIYIYTK